MSQPVLTIGMIFKDDIRSLARCLTALEPLRRAVPCELVMADTGSSDGSRELASRRADILFDFPWVDDFAAARNAVMDRASGTWFLSLDADEYLDGDIRELVRLVSGKDELSRRATFGKLIIRNYNSYEMDGSYTDFTTQRLVRMSSGQRFEGRIHETWHPAPEDTTVLLRCVLHHDGYVGLDGERGRAKRERNLRLLRRELERDPDDLTRLVQFIESGRKEPDVLFHLNRAVELVKKKPQGWNVAGPGIFRYAVSISEERNLPDLEDRVRQAMEWFPDAYCVRIDVNYLMFSHYWEAGNFRDGIPYGRAYLSAYRDSFSSEKERDRAQRETLLCGAPNHQRNMKVFLSAAILWAGEPGELEELPELLGDLDCAGLNVQQTALLAEVLSGLHAKSRLDAAPLLRAAWEGILSSEGGEDRIKARKGAFLQAGVKAFSKKPEFFRPAWEVFLPLAGECVLGDAAALMACEEPEEAAGLLNRVERWEELPAAALGHALELGAAFPPPDHPLNIEEMDGLAARLADDPEGLRRVLDRAAAANADGRWQSLAWARSLALAAVQSFDWADAAPGGVGLARTFARVESAFLAACYAPEVFQGEALRVLPPMHRFGWHCARAFNALEAGDPLGYVRLLRSGLETAPEMKSMVEYLTEHTPELETAKPSPELLAMAEKVRMMLSAYPADDPAVAALKASPAYQKVAHLIEGGEA